ncbi:hypothetical protein VTO42DRAFT_6844 [Malbranchea cinnamomea]
MSWALPTDMPSTLPPRSNLANQQSNSLPSSPYQRPRDHPFSRSRSPSPHRNPSPRSTHSEINHVLPPLRKQYGGCKYETGMAHFRRRMPYSLGSDLLPEEPGPLKERLDPEDEERLTSDMRELYDRLLPSAESEQRRSQFVRKLENLLNTRWPGNDIKVHVFGSSGNKLCSSDSDVDICITTPFKELEHVCILADFLATSGMERVVCVSHAKVPIVKIWDPELQVACDMNVNNTLALENTRMMRTYVDIDERVRPLAMIIKHWTKRRILNDAALGGTLSSYTWICLIINFLQTRTPPVLPSLQRRALEKNLPITEGSSFDDDLESLVGFGNANKSSLGSLLFQFFRYYGYEVDYEKYVMSVREGKLISKEEKRWHLLQNNRLCVEEPFNTSRNLGNTADDTSFRGLHMELRRAFRAISEGNLDECCEQYEYPPEEERVWERPPTQRRPVIATVPPLPSRGGRGGARGGRHSSNFNRRADSGRRSSSAANRQSTSRQSNPAFTAEVALQAQQAQYLLHDHLYQQIQILQAQEQELRMQLQNQALLSGRTPPTLVRPYVQFPYSHQDAATSTASEEAPRARAGTVNHPPLSTPMRQQVYYNPAFIPMTLPAPTTNPPSPPMPSAVPDARRSHRRSSIANGSPRSSNLRAQSQPARPLPSPMLQSFGSAVYNVPVRHEGSQVSGLSQGQESPQTAPVDSDNYLQNCIPVMLKPAYDENLPPEYIGYYVGGSPQLQTGYRTSMAAPLTGPSSLSLYGPAFHRYFQNSTESRNPGLSPQEQPNSDSDSHDTPNLTTPSSQPQPLTRSRTAPDCGPLIVDGSNPVHESRHSGSPASHGHTYLSQSAPSFDERFYGQPAGVGVAETLSQEYHDQPVHEHDPTFFYDSNRPPNLPHQVNGWDQYLKPRNAAINGHIGRVETLSERLQKFQMSDPNFNADKFEKSSGSPYRNTKGYHLPAEDEVLVTEQHNINEKVSKSPNQSSTKEARVALPSSKRRANGAVESEKANGSTAHKAQSKGRHEPAARTTESKEKHPESQSRKPNGVHQSNGHGSNAHATSNPSGWQTSKRKHRKGAKTQQEQSNGVEPLPADESLRKGG